MHGFYKSKSTLHILCIANSFFLNSQDLLRTFISALFLPHFDRLGAPEVSKESVPKSTFPTLDETMRRSMCVVACSCRVSFAVSLRRSPCVLICSRSSLHVRVLRCSAVEAFDARCASLHVPVVCCSSVWLAGSGPPSRHSMQDLRRCMCVSFAVPPLRPSTLDARRCMFLSFAARRCGWLALVLL